MLYFILTLLATYLLLNAVYLITFSTAAGHARPVRKTTKNDYRINTFDILIPAYKEDAVVLNTAASVLKQHYPKSHRRCVVIADGLLPATIQKLNSMGVYTIELSPDENRNKSKAINRWFALAPALNDISVVLDADNTIECDFLLKVNDQFNEGTQVLQAQRVAKNNNNQLARLDGLSEHINNHIFRKGQQAFGLSASLIGSGMAFKTPLFQSIMKDMDVFSGFDKELEIRLLAARFKIQYASHIVVYDEKVQKSSVFINQRRRWVFAQLHFLRKYGKQSCLELTQSANFDYFNKVVQFALLPRIIQIGMVSIMLPISLLQGWTALTAISFTGFVLTFLSLWNAVKGKLELGELPRLLFKLPLAFSGMFWALLTSNRAAGKFIHTPHNI